MKDLEKLRQRALRVSRRFGLTREMAEDFAQNIVLKRLEGKGLNQKTNFAVVDEMRTEFGRLRDNEPETNRHKFFNTQISIEDERTLCTPPSTETMKDLMDYLDQMEPINRCMVVLLLMWGFNRREIAFCFGMDEWKVYEIIKKETT